MAVQGVTISCPGAVGSVTYPLSFKAGMIFFIGVNQQTPGWQQVSSGYSSMSFGVALRDTAGALKNHVGAHLYKPVVWTSGSGPASPGDNYSHGSKCMATMDTLSTGFATGAVTEITSTGFTVYWDQVVSGRKFYAMAVEDYSSTPKNAALIYDYTAGYGPSTITLGDWPKGTIGINHGAGQLDGFSDHPTRTGSWIEHTLFAYSRSAGGSVNSFSLNEGIGMQNSANHRFLNNDAGPYYDCWASSPYVASSLVDGLVSADFSATGHIHYVHTPGDEGNAFVVTTAQYTCQTQHSGGTINSGSAIGTIDGKWEGGLFFGGDCQNGTLASSIGFKTPQFQVVVGMSYNTGDGRTQRFIDEKKSWMCSWNNASLDNDTKGGTATLGTNTFTLTETASGTGQERLGWFLIGSDAVMPEVSLDKVIFPQ